MSVGGELVDAAMAQLQTRGFVNYFGLQRFGGTSIATHQIGVAILKVPP